MRSIHWKTMKNSVMGIVVSAFNTVWKQTYIADDQWEQLYWEFFYCFSLVWKYPIQTTAFLICAPRLIKILLFFYPLLLSTLLFLLIVFSLGPQLERMKADRDLQWHRFKEAAVSDVVGSGGSWTCQHLYGRLAIHGGVEKNIAKYGDEWMERTEGLEELDPAIFYGEEETIEKIGKEVDYDKETQEKVGQDGGPESVSSKSLILGKVRQLMERLIDELGGRVELDALNALESITQILMGSTGRDYQIQDKYSYCLTMRKAEHELMSDDEQFQIPLHVEDCELGTPNSQTLERAPGENLEASSQDEKEEKNIDSIATETEHKKPDVRQSNKTGNVGDSEFNTRLVTFDNQTVLGLKHTPWTSKDDKEQGKNLKKDGFLNNGYVQAEGHVGDSEFIPRSTNVVGICMEQDNAVSASLAENPCAEISSISHQSHEGDDSRGIVGANQSGLKDVRTTFPIQGGGQKADGHSGLGGFELRTCRSLPVEVLEEKCWKKILSSNVDQEEHYQLSSSSVIIPEHENKKQHVSAGKLRSSLSESITFVKKPQLLSSPVILLETEDMDLLWEEYNDASQGTASARKDSIANLDGDLREMVDSDAEDLREPSQVCCLQALKFSKGRMPLKKPNLKKISKALKKLGLLQHFRSRKTA